MQKFRVLIVEDELLIAESLKSDLAKLGYLVTCICQSGNEALESFMRDEPDIILMDIKLSGNSDGIETSRMIGRLRSTPIIYLTENRDETTRKKAIFETQAVCYLNKPFNRLDLEAALDLSVKALQTTQLVARPFGTESYFSDKFIFIKEKYGFRKILTSDILFLKAGRSYCELVCKDRQMTFCESLSFFEDKLAFAKELVRIHRSFIVNIDHVQRVQENRIWIADNEIPVGRTFRQVLESKFRFI